jgi:hypothetical protein
MLYGKKDGLFGFNYVIALPNTSYEPVAESKHDFHKDVQPAFLHQWLQNNFTA